MKFPYIFGFILALGLNLSAQKKADATDLLKYVNPFIGTAVHGHTFPGATRPNAMVQFSPDTHLLGWEASSGYHASDSLIYAFSLTHLSGTGIGDLGDVALLPYSGQDSLKPIARFDKQSETASPGYYAVKLKNFGIDVELTSSPRVGLMRLKYKQAKSRRLLLDLAHVLQPNWGHKVVGNDVQLVDMQTIRGTYYTKGWAEHHQMSYTIHLSQPLDSIAIYENGKKTDVVSGLKASNKYKLSYKDTSGKYDEKLHLYLPEGNDEVYVKIGLSHVSPEGAERNLVAEVPHWDFDRLHQESRQEWANLLGRIRISSREPEVLTNFYTALYHANIAPYNYQDVDGAYRGLDKQVHKNTNPKDGHYTVFSIWDTYRTLHPLLTIIDPDKALNYGRSLVKGYEEGGILPRWPLAESYTGCMPAYHSVSILADLIAKGLVKGDNLKLWAKAGERSSVYRDDMAKKFAGTRELDLITRHPYYKETLGFIPADSVPESVSWAVEMAYDDWCIARIAEAAGLDSLRSAYDLKSKYYQKYWDKETNLMRPIMANGKFRNPFNPRFSAHEKSDYTEGNAYQWSFYAPHDMANFLKVMGGAKVLERNLDTLFTTSSRIDGAEQSGDITGLIGQYAHGNEPSHHIAYLYNYTAHPEKGQAILDKVMREFYLPTPEGIIGNEDCGQMSAWYIMSALGFYPVCPGSDVYHIGRPMIDHAEVAVRGGVFKVEVLNNSPEHKRVASVHINGRKVNNFQIRHKELRAGGVLRIVMTK